MKIAIIGAVLLALFLTWRFTPLAEMITVEHISALAHTVGRAPWSPYALAVAYTPAAFVMFPRPLLTLFAVIAYGPWIGFATSFGGIALAELVSYGCGRALSEKAIRRFAGDKATRTRAALRKHGIAASFAFSIVPMAPAPVIGMIAGAARMQAWQFLLGAMLGMLPGILATTLFAGQLAKVLDEAEDVNWWIVAGVIVAFAALILAVRTWIHRRILPSRPSS